MSTKPVVAISGLTALRKNLLALGDEGSAMIAELQKASADALQPVMTKARAAWPRSDLNHPHHADSLRITGTKTGGTLREGGVRYGGTGWLEFGGSRGGIADRAFIKNGRYLYPAAASVAEEVAELYSKAIQKVINEPGSWTNHGDNASEVTG